MQKKNAWQSFDFLTFHLSLSLHLFPLIQGTEQPIICLMLIFWFPHSAAVADQHLMGQAVSES